MIEQRGKHTYIPQRASLPAQNKHRPIADDLEDDESYDPVRPPRSAIRYTTTQEQIIQQGNKRIVIHHGMPPSRHSPQSQAQQTAPEAHRTHWLLYVGLVMLLMLIGWILVTMLLHWWQVTQDDWHYGRPRTFQIDQQVGHGDSTIPSHFITMNLDHRVQVIECPASDCSKAIVYLGAQIIGNEEDLTTITLTFKDVNGDGKLDMLVHVADQTYVYINDNGRFRPAKPDEHLSL